MDVDAKDVLFPSGQVCRQDDKGNLEATLVWPHETGILRTIRLEMMRDAIEDYNMIMMLKAIALSTPKNEKKLALQIRAVKLWNNGNVNEGIITAFDLEKRRNKIGKLLSEWNDLR